MRLPYHETIRRRCTQAVVSRVPASPLPVPFSRDRDVASVAQPSRSDLADAPWRGFRPEHRLFEARLALDLLELLHLASRPRQV